MSSPGATELLIVLVIVLLILGPKRLPSLGRQLGGGIREFRRSLGGGSSPERPDPARTHETTTVAPGTSAAAPPAAESDAERRSA
ncbi:MAG: hypothetical protein AVDCRST_MAG38-1945 [uncultured Solirubrobacteraceae bacterium]|uniref:Sec-independent protein translocase protein TatA n=1 Tax=uncultured Solirubrobacteraceae bacterium TaxID=1162706 RepID=A0A6J4RQW6_9ACTN|nr:MAG: hypothetical protein AVDCRST_MAG38-1945 [uncultured Solirubrobacteraceae bacterium]